MAETVAASDMGIGLAMVFTLLAVAASVGLGLFAEVRVVAGWLFAAAMVAGTIAVAAPHLYGVR